MNTKSSLRGSTGTLNKFLNEKTSHSKTDTSNKMEEGDNIKSHERVSVSAFNENANSTISFNSKS